MTNPLLSSVEELLKVTQLMVRFIDQDDVDELNEELQKLGIEEGFGARAKKAIENPLTEREIKMARFLATECLEGLSRADAALTITQDCTFHPKMLMAAGAAEVNADELRASLIGAKERVTGLARHIRSADGPIGDFTEEEAKIIREAK